MTPLCLVRHPDQISLPLSPLTVELLLKLLHSLSCPGFVVLDPLACVVRTGSNIRIDAVVSIRLGPFLRLSLCISAGEKINIIFALPTVAATSLSGLTDFWSCGKHDSMREEGTPWERRSRFEGNTRYLLDGINPELLE